MSKGISRRHFLITGASALAACFLPADVLRRARQHQLDHDGILIEEPDGWISTLYANVKDTNHWQFSLNGYTDSWPKAPSWREYLENTQLVQTSNRKELADWIRENRDWYRLSPRSRDWLDKQVSHSAWESYLEGRYAWNDSPEAQALLYLHGLKLQNGTVSDGEGRNVGDLNYYFGVNPGNDWHFAEAEGDLVLPALQHRLRELGEKTRIVINP